MSEDHSYLWIAPLGTPTPKRRGWLRRFFTRRGAWQFVGITTDVVLVREPEPVKRYYPGQAEASHIEHAALELPATTTGLKMPSMAQDPEQYQKYVSQRIASFYDTLPYCYNCGDADGGCRQCEGPGSER